MKIRLIVAASLIALAQIVLASDNVTAKVVYVGTYGNGDLFINTDTQINEATCPSTRIDVVSTNPQIKNWLTIAETALASGKSIMVRTNGCYVGRPTMDTNRDSAIGSPFSFMLILNN